ncbi:MAG TPA: dienelactone hydrolase family protein [Thermodesulfovibrionales bacterium]|nr:dienelactone hydrolase family protein [Thermodesulfovibrionales bacterium]
MVEDWLANVYEGMTRRQFLARMSAAGVGLTGFAIASSSVDGEVITTSDSGLAVADSTVLSGDFPVPVYEARPAAPGKYPILVVIPEIFGMHEHIKDVTRRFAKEGYLSITFEPYAREGGVLNLPDIPAVRKVADSVPDARVMADLDAIVAYAKQEPAARPDRIGVTGFCRGGMYALLYAAHSHELNAAVAWYGQIRPEKKEGIRTAGPLDVAAQIRPPVLGLYGEADLGIPVADVKEMEAALRAAGRTAEFVLYPGAPHAFFADYRPSYRPDTAKDAWNRCTAWLGKYLKA